MPAPTFIQEAESTWTQLAGGVASKSTGSFAVQAGDLLVAIAASEDYNSSLGLTVSGGGLTWTVQQAVQVVGNCAVTIATATVAADATITATLTRSATGSGCFCGLNVLTYRSHGGVGSSGKTNVTTNGAPSLSLTTAGANSAVVVVNADWNASDGTTRTWRTVNGVTPTAASGEQTYFRDAATYTVYGAYYSDAGAAGAKTVGLTTPSAQKYSIAAVEIKGTAGGGGATPTYVSQLLTLGVG